MGSTFQNSVFQINEELEAVCIHWYFVWPPLQSSFLKIRPMNIFIKKSQKSTILFFMKQYSMISSCNVPFQRTKW